MKKSVIKTICGVVAAISLVMVCGEATSLLNQVLWSGAWFAIFLASAKGLEYCLTDEEKEERV
jgi:hypothetical protein